jgi:hypothetical protein
MENCQTSSKHVVVLVSLMPCEIGASALYKCLDESSYVMPMKINEARSFDLTTNRIMEVSSAPSEIIMLGTYWIEPLPLLMEKYNNTKFTVYCPGEIPDITSNNLTMDSADSGVGMATYMLNMAKKRSGSASLIKLFENKFSHVINLMDDRAYGRNLAETQPFYTGIFNYGSINIDIYDKFVKLFEGDYSIKEIIKAGKMIVSAQMQMAQERVLKNSKVTKLSDGSIAVVTEAPDLMNLTHESLHQKHPEAQITILMNMKFSQSGSDELCYSFRSFNINVDVSSLAKKVNGDGSKTAAGGRVKHEFPIIF